MPDVRWRLADAERRLEHLEERTEDLSALKAEIESLQKQIETLALVWGKRTDEIQEEVRVLRRTLITAAVSFAGGALLLAVSIALTFQ